ncbi:hypothetical protein [Pandoraea sputorum]|uniref:hypothetical protein n=1 Tax=Pandoraea sputorum TaxID=93222 RepID=UPI002AF6B110|nr:hypothetical protein [Pandoraea sputorum]
MSAPEKLTNFALLRFAWKISGGWGEAFRSREFHIAVFVTVLCTHFWIECEWYEQVLSVMPNVLGFTLGGFAIFLGFGDERFKGLLAGKDDGDSEESPYLGFAAAFVTFVFFQILSILYAIVAKSLSFPTPKFLYPIANYLHTGYIFSSFLGYFLFIYALTLALRATLRVFRLARWYDIFVADDRKREKEKTSTPPKRRLCSRQRNRRQ